MIFALDIATVTGCCDGKIGSDPRIWTWDLRDCREVFARNNSWENRLTLFSSFLDAYFANVPKDDLAVIYEAPMPLSGMMQAGAREETVALWRGAIGVLVAKCGRSDVPVEGHYASTIRKAVLGWGRNPDPKVPVKTAVCRAVNAFGVRHKDGRELNHDEADAWV